LPLFKMASISGYLGCRPLAGARHHIADHEHVGLKSHLVGAVALDQLDAQAAQLVAHGRVDAGVATRDFVPRLPRQGGQAAHESAADSQNMYVHGPVF
jgi:hypothetical protein